MTTSYNEPDQRQQKPQAALWCHCINGQTVTSGFMRELGPDRWFLLCNLASYMDEEGKAYPPHDQLVADLGMARQSLNRLIQQLIDFKWNGQHILTVEQHGNGFKKNNIYTIKAEPFIQKFNGTEEPVMSLVSPTVNSSVPLEGDTNNTTALNYTTVNNEITTAKEVVTHFTKLYRQYYAVNYSVNWKRDMSMGKKLLTAFPGKVKDILEVVFAEFETRWKKEKYPRPSLGAIVSWLGNEALALVDEVRAREARLEAAEQEPQQDVEAIMARLNRGRKKPGDPGQCNPLDKNIYKPCHNRI